MKINVGSFSQVGNSSCYGSIYWVVRFGQWWDNRGGLVSRVGLIRHIDRVKIIMSVLVGLASHSLADCVCEKTAIPPNGQSCEIHGI